jgi:hypothetical protein
MMKDAKRYRLPTYKPHVTVLHFYSEASGDFSYRNFKHVQSGTGLSETNVRRISRYLCRKGYLKYGKGLWTEDGTPAGAGYAVTSMGHALAELLRAKEG